MKNLDIILDILSYDGSQTNDPEDAIKIKNRVKETDMTAVSRQYIQLPDSTVDSTITIPDANSDYLAILSNRDISIKLDGSSTAISLKTRAAGKRTLVFFAKGPITALTISNASGGVADVDVFIANK